MRSAALMMMSVLVPMAFGQGLCRDLDATKLRIGSFRYQTLVDGKDGGESRIRIRRSRESGNVIFSNVVTGAFSQSWESVATPRFAPLTAKLVFGEGDSARTAFELTYGERRVTGFAVATKAQPPVRRELDEALAAG